MLAILYYDHCMTFLPEIRLVWMKRPSFCSYLFLVNRYVTSLGYLVVIFFTYNAPGDIMVGFLLTI